MEKDIGKDKDKEIKEFSDLKMIIEPEKELPLSGYQPGDDISPEESKPQNVKTTVIGKDSKIQTVTPLSNLLNKKLNPDNYLFLWNKQTMLPSKELDILSDKVKSDKLPDMFFGYNRFYVVFPQEKNLILEISPIQMVDYTNFDIIKGCLVEEGKTAPDSKSQPSKDTLNCTYYFPEEVKSQFWDKWKNIKIPDMAEIQTMKSSSDWAYSSPYMGVFSHLSKHGLLTEVKKGNYQYLKAFEKVEANDSESPVQFIREPTKEGIPFEKLSPENPVINFWELPLYDDELNDNGLSMGNFRLRVMKDCFFGLLRSYLRVDNVMVRIVDTRIYHELGSNVIIRDFQVRENTYDQIKSKGFTISSEWSLSHSQSDMIYQTLDVKMHLNDKITIVKK
mmetsp:Transcript_26928/g.27967  ORF Transcript_26928/g.27967 Transcript_26928/m.27967 type:complete len:391 (-) Transcript_26928:31-1203(-)